MRTFFRSFTSSLTRPTYYKDILQAQLRFSIKYYIVLSLLLILANTMAGILNYAPAIKNNLIESAKEVVQNFPQDLTLTISPNGISASKDFPLIAQMPSILTGGNKSNPREDITRRNGAARQPQNLAVIDPNGEVSALEKYNALILINSSYIVVGDGGSVQTASLKDFPETRIDYFTMQQFSQTLLFIAQHIYIFTAGFFTVSGLLSFFAWRPLYLAIFAFGLWLTYKSTVGTYSKAFQVGLHSVTLPLLVSTTFGIAGVAAPFPGWFVVIHTVFTFYILSRLEKRVI